MTLTGIDISHWNKPDILDKNIQNDFVIMKASEGNSFRDSMMRTHYEKAKFYGYFIGFYHFARPDLGNKASTEARNFIETIPERNNVLLALDIEGNALKVKNIDEWAYDWMQYVEAHTSIKPLLYCSQSQTNKFNMVYKNNNGLWVARYRPKILGYGKVSPWKFAAIWQYTSEPIDKNIFFGNEHQLLKYMKGA